MGTKVILDYDEYIKAVTDMGPIDEACMTSPTSFGILAEFIYEIDKDRINTGAPF